MDTILESESLAYKFVNTAKDLDEVTQVFESMRSRAACDCKCRFVYAALAAPGAANDNILVS